MRICRCVDDVCRKHTYLLVSNHQSLIPNQSRFNFASWFFVPTTQLFMRNWDSQASIIEVGLNLLNNLTYPKFVQCEDLNLWIYNKTTKKKL